MIQSGQRHSSCSASSKAIVFLPSMRYGSFSVDTSYQPERPPDLGGQAPRVGNQAVHKRGRRPVERTLVGEWPLHIARHEHLRLEAGRAPRTPPSRSRRSGRRDRERRRAQRARTGHGRGLPARLEGIRRVERFVLDVEARQAERPTRAVRAWISGVNPSPKVTWRFAGEERQQLPIPPERRLTIAKRFALPARAASRSYRASRGAPQVQR